MKVFCAMPYQAAGDIRPVTPIPVAPVVHSLKPGALGWQADCSGRLSALPIPPGHQGF